jgi:hypothetical protein
MRVGVVMRVSGSSLVIQTPDGGIYAARGDAQVGRRVFFNVDGAVVGDAPVGEFVDIEV